MVKQRNALTKIAVEKAHPEPGRQLFLWDSKVPGFGVRIFPSGRRKYIFQYRTQGRRQRRMVLGVHGPLTPEKARGLAAVDGPFAAIRDLDGLREAARRARAVGCDGKWALHPDQVAVVNEVFSPGRDEVARAQAIVAALADAADAGRGVLSHGDEMIDEATRKTAEDVLARARAAGLVG